MGGGATDEAGVVCTTTSTAASIDSQYGFPVHVNPLLAAHTPWPPQQQRQHQQQLLLRQDLAALCIASPHAQLPARFRAALPVAWASSRARGLDDQLRDELLTRGAAVNRTSNDGRTPLCRARRHGPAAVEALLRAAGAT